MLGLGFPKIFHREARSRQMGSEVGGGRWAKSAEASGGWHCAPMQFEPRGPTPARCGAASASASCVAWQPVSWATKTLSQGSSSLAGTRDPRVHGAETDQHCGG